MELTKSQIESTLHEMAGKTIKDMPIVRFRTEYDPFNPDAGRTYDHNKITSDLAGKQVRIEIYSVSCNAENVITGCYRGITGVVKEIIPGSGSVMFIVFNDNKVLDPFSLTDIKIEVLEAVNA